MKNLLDAIDNGLSNRYKVLDGDKHTLCVKDRETGKHFDIIVKDCEEESANEEFVDKLLAIDGCCLGEPELVLENGEWYVRDYRDWMEASYGLSKYPDPLITEEEAERLGIDVRKCCDKAGYYIVG